MTSTLTYRATELRIYRALRNPLRVGSCSNLCLIPKYLKTVKKTMLIE